MKRLSAELKELREKLRPLTDAELFDLGYVRTLRVTEPPQFDPPEQIKVAADWWVKTLSQSPTHNNGDIFQTILATALAADLPPLRQEQLDAFGKWLAYLLYHSFVEDGAWNPEQPNFGSAYRSVSVDYGPDPILRAAADMAGIPRREDRFPCKTVMWVNPDKVQVRAGYHGREEILWSAEKATA